MAKIKSLTIVTNEGVGIYTVGRPWPIQATRTISEIKSNSCLFNHYTAIDQNGKKIADFISCPAIIEYYED